MDDVRGRDRARPWSLPSAPFVPSGMGNRASSPEDRFQRPSRKQLDSPAPPRLGLDLRQGEDRSTLRANPFPL